MTPEERDALLAAFLNKTITPEEKTRLVEELRSDHRFAKTAHDQWTIDRILQQELDTRARRAFVEAVSEKIQQISRDMEAGPMAGGARQEEPEPEPPSR